jgi:hypothetical protein
MSASRGDTKPCTATECAGTMQFGRRSDNDRSAPDVRRPGVRPDIEMEAKGWVCSAEPNHFRREET